jgi:dephospho-CoA kinase
MLSDEMLHDLACMVLVRGLPGSGKSSFARLLARSGFKAFAADDFFHTKDGYLFDIDRISEAHADCRDRASEALCRVEKIVIHNTFSRHWEMETYIKLAEGQAAFIFVVDLFDAGLSDEALAERCIHNVPVQVIAKMRERWEHSWQST